MRKSIIALTAIAAIAIQGVPCVAAEGAVPVQAYVDPYDERQTMDGVGGGITWYKDWLTENKYSDEIFDWLFNKAGLDVIRFRNTYEYVLEDGTNDFKPEQEKEIIEKAEEAAGHEMTVLLSSWSPSGELKDNDTVAGGVTLKKDENGSYVYDEYGDYYKRAIEAYREAGVDIDYLSIQNEPDFKADYDSCRLDAAESAEIAGYPEAYSAVYKALSELESPPGMAGPDTMSASFSVLESYVDAVEAKHPGSLDIIAHHLYTGGYETDPDSYIKSMNKLRNKYPDKRRWQTEYYRGDPVQTGWLIHNCFTEEDANAYIYWDTIWGDSDESPVSLKYPWTMEWSDTNKGYEIHDKLYSLMHFGKYMDPGYKRVSTTCSVQEVKVSAYISPEADKLTFVIVNTGESDADVALGLNGYNDESSEVFVSDFSEGGTDRFASKGAMVNGSVEVPAYGMATVAIEGSRGEKPSEILTADESWREGLKAPEAVAVYGTPDAIDAKADSAWENAGFINAERAAHGDHGASARFKLMWDEENLYVYAEVSDTTPDTAAEDAYQRDSVELFINEDGTKPDSYGEGDGQYRVDLNNERSYGSGASENDGFITAVEKTDTGYIVEAALPFRATAPETGNKIGFDFQVNDAHGNGERGYILKWSDATDLTWSTLEDIGTVVLTKGITVEVNGEALKADVEPELYNDSVLIPFRALFEALGAEVEYIDEGQYVRASKDGMEIELQIGSLSAKINGAEYQMPVAPVISNERTLVPLRFAAEALNAEVNWDSSLSKASIVTE